MRIIVFVLALAFGSALWPVVAGAKTPEAAVVAAATPAPTDNAVPDVAQSVPMPREPSVEVSHGRIAAIAIGAAVGIVAANVVTGGLITPVLSAGMAAAPAAAAAQATVVYMSVTAQAVVTAAGALVGGYVGNWLYGN